MKTLANINQTLQQFEKTYGLGAREAQQRSEAWFQMKLGVVSASRFSEAVAKKDSATRMTYMAELIGEVCTGVIEELDFKQTDWGTQHEDAARSAYEFSSGCKMTPLGFVFKDLKDKPFRAGCSPDGAIFPVRPCEIKCPWATENYIKFLLDGIQKPEWKWQNQGTIWVMDAEEMDVTHYDPRMKVSPHHTLLVKRDSEMQLKLDDMIPAFIEDMDKYLAEIGIKFGDHWVRIAANKEKGAASA